jgi:hypothetical protein
MSNARPLLLVFPILLAVLACQSITQPIQQGENAVSTAAAFATQAEVLVTQLAPLETPLAVPTGDMNIPAGNPFNPIGEPLDSWKEEIPIMPAATVGDEAEGMYGYKVDAMPEEIMDFYAKSLPPLGWVENVILPYSDGMAILIYAPKWMAACWYC